MFVKTPLRGQADAVQWLGEPNGLGLRKILKRVKNDVNKAVIRKTWPKVLFDVSGSGKNRATTMAAAFDSNEWLRLMEECHGHVQEDVPSGSDEEYTP